MDLYWSDICDRLWLKLPLSPPPPHPCPINNRPQQPKIAHLEVMVHSC
ncbi:hypothetical protein [Nostoc sp. FACHB-133]|nr:hypothetical protein [Nostoc sp. FACHB-133]MBD2527622.1 hypothetical protein [Nostoc sp. FACHB-133]